MRIAFVADATHHHGLTRASSRLDAFLGGLVRAGHEVPVVTTRWWEADRARHHDRWTVHVDAGLRRLRPLRVLRRVAALDPDVVHLWDAPATAAVAAGSLRHTPVVHEATGFDAPLAGRGRLARLARWRVDRAIVPSETVETALLEAGVDVPVDRLADPIDVDEVRRVVPADRADIVWSAPGHGEEDLEMLLLGLAELRRKDWRALLLGPLADPAGARDQMTALGIADRIDHVPDPDRRERLAYYRGASAFVQTAPVCPFPLELLRAMAAGCVGVVQYQERSSAHELVEAHPRGELISTPEELAEAITAAAGRERATFDGTFERYDVDAATDRLVGVYRGLVTGT